MPGNRGFGMPGIRPSTSSDEAKSECGPVVVPKERDYAAASMWNVMKSEPENRRKANRRTGEKRTEECRMSNRRMSKGGIAALCLFYKIDRIPSFDIRYSSVLRFAFPAVLRFAVLYLSLSGGGSQQSWMTHRF